MLAEGIWQTTLIGRGALKHGVPVTKADDWMVRTCERGTKIVL